MVRVILLRNEDLQRDEFHLLQVNLVVHSVYSSTEIVDIAKGIISVRWDLDEPFFSFIDPFFHDRKVTFFVLADRNSVSGVDVVWWVVKNASVVIHHGHFFVFTKVPNDQRLRRSYLDAFLALTLKGAGG